MIKTFLMIKEPVWWIWRMTALLLALGLSGVKAGYGLARVLSFAQTAWFIGRHRTVSRVARRG